LTCDRYQILVLEITFESHQELKVPITRGCIPGQDSVAAFLQDMDIHMPQLSQGQKDMLEQEFTFDEVRLAKKTKRHARKGIFI